MNSGATHSSAADRVKRHGHDARPWPGRRSQSAAVSPSSRGRRLTEPVTESNLRLHPPAQVAARLCAATRVAGAAIGVPGLVEVTDVEDSQDECNERHDTEE